MVLHKSENRTLALPKLATDADDKALYDKCIADGWYEEEKQKVKEPFKNKGK